MERIETGQWLCSTSRFTVLEMLDAKQEERFVQNRLAEGLTLSQIVRRLGGRRSGKFRLRAKELDEIYSELHDALETSYGFIAFQRPLAELWDQAEEFCADTNIAPADSIHLATAVGAQCDLLVTRDTDFLTIARQYIAAVAPERAPGALRELGFAVA